MQLRPYQQRAVEELRKHCRDRPILVAPCGAGKTTIAAEIIRSAVARGNRALFLVHRRELMQQAVARLRLVGLDPYTVQAGQRIRPGGACYVASIQTLVRRAVIPNVKLLIIDECSHARAETWDAAIQMYGDATRIGLTATPYRLDAKGLGKTFGAIVIAATYKELFENGTLIKPRIFAPPGPQESIRTRSGEFEMGSASRVMMQLTGDVVEHWHKHAQNGRSIVYACGVEHAEQLAERFGEIARSVHSRISRDERDARMAKLAAGDIRIITNCEVLTEGWDLPELECVSIARPTLSRALHCQMIGRVLRTHPNKQRAVVIDHAGNHDRHNEAWLDLDYTLDETDPIKGEVTGMRRCRACYALFDIWEERCPECGWCPEENRGERQRLPGEDDGQLVEWTPERTEAYRKARYAAMVEQADGLGYKLGWARNKYRSEFGTWPPRKFKAMEHELYHCSRHAPVPGEWGTRCNWCLSK